MNFFAKDEGKNLKKLSLQLLNWYATIKRDLPWRKTNDEYAILVSEVMLQQTQVSTVIPYYERWMQRWPNWQTLAESTEEEVIKLWEGLGYYSRARALRAIARIIMSSKEGRLPRSFDQLMELPGIGEYTAGAVASIAFGLRAAAIDGNVRRVIGRWAAVPHHLRASTRHRQIKDVLESILPKQASRCGDFNQALMELGALVCRPKEPRCHACPWKKSCRLQNNKDASLGAVTRAKNIKSCVEVWAWIEKGSRIWCEKPAPNGLLSGLWTLPKFNADTMRKIESLGEIKFAVSTRRVHAKVMRCEWLLKKDKTQSGAWLNASEINRRPFSAASRKFISKMRWTA